MTLMSRPVNCTKLSERFQAKPDATVASSAFLSEEVVDIDTDMPSTLFGDAVSREVVAATGSEE